MRRSLLIVVASFALLLAAPVAGAAPGMFVGVSENALEWNTGATVAAARDLGFRAFRLTLDWAPGQRDVTAEDAALLTNAVVGAGGMRIVLATFNQNGAPRDAAGRDAYCTYVGNVMARFPQINDFVIWNEPNLSAFWQPQYTLQGVSEAPARYEELLAQCWDVLHGLRSSVNVIAPATSVFGNDNPNAFSNVSHSPTTFIRDMGTAYRASGRTRPLFDTLGHHPYPARSNERPWTVHSDPAIISTGDFDRLLAVVREAFGGTAQKLPENGLPIWYLETGYQTRIDDAKAGLYAGIENWPGAVPDLAPPQARVFPPDDSPAPDQATQLSDSFWLNYCQPYVGAVFNFLLRDERDLGGWQSGLLWADGSRKDSYDAVRDAIGKVNGNRVDCGSLSGAPGVAPSTATSAAAGSKPTAGKPGTGSGGSGSVQTPGAQKARSVTRVTYTGGKRVPFGFLGLRARLTRGVTDTSQGLAARQLLFVVGDDAFLTTTDGSGRAGVEPRPPVRIGMHRIAVRFQGDDIDLGSGLRVDAQVVNSHARVRTSGTVRLGTSLVGSISARSDGRSVSGRLVLRDHGVVHAVRIREFGLRTDRRAAWLAGFDPRGTRYLIELQRRSRTTSMHVRIWRNDKPIDAGAFVSAKRLSLSRA